MLDLLAALSGRQLGNQSVEHEELLLLLEISQGQDLTTGQNGVANIGKLCFHSPDFCFRLITYIFVMHIS